MKKNHRLNDTFVCTNSVMPTIVKYTRLTFSQYSAYFHGSCPIIGRRSYSSGISGTRTGKYVFSALTPWMTNTNPNATQNPRDLNSRFTARPGGGGSTSDKQIDASGNGSRSFS